MNVTRVVEHIEEYHLAFTDEYGAGYGFDSTSDGQIINIGPYAWGSLHCAIDGYLEGEYRMHIQDFSRDMKHYEGTCDCGEELIAYGGYDEFSCEKCGAEYSIWGQRLRSNWRNNPSNWDREIDDMTGYELEMAGDE